MACSATAVEAIQRIPVPIPTYSLPQETIPSALLFVDPYTQFVIPKRSEESAVACSVNAARNKQIPRRLNAVSE